jgi:hypothetical protein
MLNSKHAKLSACRKLVYVSRESGKSFWNFTLHFKISNVAFVNLTNLAGIPSTYVAFKNVSFNAVVSSFEIDK